MQPIRTLRNQYRGINAHLHSYWQVEGGWNNFHNAHITYIASLLRPQLLAMGYTATMEEGLQVRRVGDDVRRPRADLVISDPDPVRAGLPVYRAATTATATFALAVADLVDSIDEEHPYRALAIFEQGKPHAVAWIELVSPTNKGNTHDAGIYRGKRDLLLSAGTVFIELDYLHELPPTFERLADYTNPQQRHQAHPYRIVILDPRPDFETGPAQLAEFDVDSPIPTLIIPLNAGDQIAADFGAAYRKTFEEMAYGLELVDYGAFPAHFGHYSEADQTRIARRMVAVLHAARDGADVNTPDTPLPIDEIDLEAALAEIGRLQGA